MAFDVDERAPAVDPVVVEDLADGGAERQPGERPRDARARRGPAVALFQIRFGHRYIAPPAESHVEPPARR